MLVQPRKEDGTGRHTAARLTCKTKPGTPLASGREIPEYFEYLTKKPPPSQSTAVA